MMMPFAFRRRSLPPALPALLLWAALSVATTPLAAQEDGPALDTGDGGFATAPAEEPAVQPARQARSGGSGTTVVGEGESPIGLYIMPWRASAPDPELDRPARFVDAQEKPVDALQFERFVEYHEALSRHRAAQMAAESRDSAEPR